jgi:N-acetylglucosaminyldiphosphoundecaprenol N-acetyl-beta-D-mannosaminyltransferase
MPVDPVDPVRAARVVTRHITESALMQVVTINAEMALNARKDAALADAIRRAGLVLPDGSGVVWAARRRGLKVRKLPGVEFIQEICAVCARLGRPVYLLGAGPGVAQSAADVLTARHKNLQVAGVRDGYFKPEDEPEILEAIRQAAPAALFVALGVPRQEFWIAKHQADLGVPVAMGVGGSFDVLSGRLKRAPGWMQQLHLEWLYRLVQEPWRWKRMLSALPTFAILALAAERAERYTGAGEQVPAIGQQPGVQLGAEGIRQGE